MPSKVRKPPVRNIRRESVQSAVSAVSEATTITSVSKVTTITSVSKVAG
jgi:hypothetical protein